MASGARTPPPTGRPLPLVQHPPQTEREPDLTPASAPEPHFRGEDSPLVRPYLLAHERRQALAQAQTEVRRQRSRRRALWLAVHGVDIGPRVIHGREVAA